MAPTPFYLISVEPIREALAELKKFAAGIPIPVRHWLSCKTQPVRPLLQWWQRQGSGIEVVSEFEFQAALHEGFAPDHILLNGPAKHRWLPQHAIHGLRVNFDSVTELDSLLPLARKLDWSVGVRCHIEDEPDRYSEYPAQFGMAFGEVVWALKKLARSGVRLETIHFHCGTHVGSPIVYAHALSHIADLCSAARFAPKYLDCGGGLPPPNVLSLKGHAYDAHFDMAELAAMYSLALKSFPSVQELWLENGRFLTARSGVLVVRILDAKDRGELRHLICDGGRTMTALISLWEAHEFFSLTRRNGPERLTSVCGPTCMAFDRLARQPMSSRLRVGDYLVWMDAGAYHIPWETRFSHGHAAVLWHERDRLTVARAAQSFDSWWEGEWLDR